MTTTTSTRLGTSTDSLLRLALRADAVLSGLTGIALVAFAPTVAELSGTTAAIEYTTGALFVVFAATVWALAARPAIRTSGVVVAVANALYSVASVVVVLTGVWPLTTTGIVLTLGCGAYTLVMAELQYRGVRRI